MEPDQTPQVEVERKSRFENLKKVTPLSKYLAMALFVILPFLGGYIGYTYAPEKVVEVETATVTEQNEDFSKERQVSIDNNNQSEAKNNEINEITNLPILEGQDIDSIATYVKDLSENKPPGTTMEETRYMEPAFSLWFIDGTAMVTLRGESSGWDVYHIDDASGAYKKVYENLAADCCGGSMPSFSNYGGYTKVVSGGGDIAGFYSEVLFYDSENDDLVAAYKNSYQPHVVSLEMENTRDVKLVAELSEKCDADTPEKQPLLSNISLVSEDVEHFFEFQDSINVDCYHSSDFGSSARVDFDNIKPSFNDDFSISFDMKYFTNEVEKTDQFYASLVNGLKREEY